MKLSAVSRQLSATYEQKLVQLLEGWDIRRSDIAKLKADG